MNAPVVYLIPGLAADARLFSELKKHFEFEVLEFLIPEPEETMEQYARRMAERIDTSKPFIIGGVSFGGMVASCIASFTKPELVIYISSVKTSGEFPFWLKAFRVIPLQRWLPVKFIKKFGPKSPFRTDRAHRKLLDDMRRDAPPALVIWSLDQAARFSLKKISAPFIHIHGTRDLLLPGMLVKGKIPVPKGDHVMVLGRAAEIAAILRKEVAERLK